MSKKHSVDIVLGITVDLSFNFCILDASNAGGSGGLAGNVLPRSHGLETTAVACLLHHPRMSHSSLSSRPSFGRDIMSCKSFQLWQDIHLLWDYCSS